MNLGASQSALTANGLGLGSYLGFPGWRAVICKPTQLFLPSSCLWLVFYHSDCDNKSNKNSYNFFPNFPTCSNHHQLTDKQKSRAFPEQVQQRPPGDSTGYVHSLRVMCLAAWHLPAETDVNQATSLSPLPCLLQSQPKSAHIMDLSHKTFVDIANIMIPGKRGKHEERTMFSSVSVKQLAVTLLQSPKYIDTGTKESSVSLRTQLSRRLGLAQPACLPLQCLLAHRQGEIPNSSFWYNTW